MRKIRSTVTTVAVLIVSLGAPGGIEAGGVSDLYPGACMENLLQTVVRELRGRNDLRFNARLSGRGEALRLVPSPNNHQRLMDELKDILEERGILSSSVRCEGKRGCVLYLLSVKDDVVGAGPDASVAERFLAKALRSSGRMRLAFASQDYLDGSANFVLRADQKDPVLLLPWDLFAARRGSLIHEIGHWRRYRRFKAEVDGGATARTADPFRFYFTHPKEATYVSPRLKRLIRSEYALFSVDEVDSYARQSIHAAHELRTKIAHYERSPSLELAVEIFRDRHEFEVSQEMVSQFVHLIAPSAEEMIEEGRKFVLESADGLAGDRIARLANGATVSYTQKQLAVRFDVPLEKLGRDEGLERELLQKAFLIQVNHVSALLKSLQKSVERTRPAWDRFLQEVAK